MLMVRGRNGEGAGVLGEALNAKKGQKSRVNKL